jgi:hypothetical protein
MKITIAMKRDIALRMGITPAQFEAYRKSEAAKNKALKAMTADERRAYLEAEAESRARVAAERRAERMKRDGITTQAYEITGEVK